MLSPASLLFRYCSEDRLRSICKAKSIRMQRSTKIELAEAVVKRIGSEHAWGLLDELDLGRTTLFLYVLPGPVGAPEADKLGDLLVRQYSYDPFALPPEAASALSSGFKAAAAREWGGDIRIYWARRARVTLARQFEVEREWQDEYAVTELTPGDRLVRTWADAAAASSISQELFTVLGEFLSPVVFKRATLDALRAGLPGSSVETERVQDDSLGFSILEATKRPEDRSIEDAAGYGSVLAGKPVIALTIYFSVPDAQQRVGLKITRAGGLLFRSYVRPAVVSYVLSQVRQALSI